MATYPAPMKYLGEYVSDIFNVNSFKTNIVNASSVITNELVSDNVTTSTATISASANPVSLDSNDNTLATTAFVQGNIGLAIGNLLDGADSGYNTLKELENYLKDDDNAISGLLSTVGLKTDISAFNDLSSNFNTFVMDTMIKNMQQDSSLNDISNDIIALNSSVNSLNSKTSAISVSGSTTTINSRLVVTAGANGNVQLGNQAGDSLSVLCGTTSFVNGSISQNAVNGLSSRLSNVDTSLNSLQSSKADTSQIIYRNKWNVNAQVNTLASVLSAIGMSSAQAIEFSAGTHSNSVTPQNIDVSNLTLYGVDSAFASPSTLLNYAVTFQGSTMTRSRVSNIGFMEDVIVNGTQGRHTFKGCVFQKNMTFLNSTTNFINFYYCSFMGQINIPITFAGYIIFYFCDFSGATLNFNNSLPLQIYINSCVNLPTLTGLNASLNGYNVTVAQDSGLATTTLNVSGATQFPSGSISQASISNLSNDLNNRLTLTDASNNYLKLIDASNNYATINNLGVTNSNVSSLQSSVDTLNSRTNALNFDASSNTTTINSRLLVTGNDSVNGSVFLGDGSGNDQIFLRGSLIANGQTVSAVRVGHLSTLTGNVQTQLDARAPINNPTFTGTVSGITKDMVGLGNVDNISDISKGISIATQNALDLKADISLVDFKVAQLVNSAPEALNTLNELSQALGNDPNFASSVSTAIGLRALDVSAVHVTGNENISGQKNFLTGITLNGTDLNTRLNGNESNISSLQSSVNTLNSRTGALNFDASSNTTTINSRLQVTGDDLNNGSVFLGDGSGNDQIFLRGSLIANGQTVSAVRIGHLSTLTGNVQTQLNAKANIVDVSDTYVRIVDASNTYLRLVDASNNYATISNLGVTNTNVSNLSGRMTTAETNISGLQSGKANISDVSASFLTQSSASTTYATLSSLSTTNTNVTNLTNTVNLKANIADVSASFITLAGNNTITGQNVFNNVQTVERMCEQIHQAGSGGALSLSFTGIKGIVQYAPSANYTLTLTNVPTSNTNCVYTLTFRYSTKFYANAISVNGSSITMTAVGGLSNLTINASSTIVYQTIHIIFNNSSTPTVSTSLLALW